MAQAPRPVTPEDFRQLTADLRAELAEATALQRERLLSRPMRQAAPGSFTGRPWVRRRVNLHEAADLTGLAYHSLRVYRNQGNKDRTGGVETERSMPAESDAGGWVIGSLALWLATREPGRMKGAAQGFSKGGRWPGRESYLPQLRKWVAELDGKPVSVTAAADALGVERTLARNLLRQIGALPRRVTDAAALEFLRRLAEEKGRRVTLRELLEYLDDAGLKMWAPRASRLYRQAGGRLPVGGRMDGPERAGPESLRWDGLLTQAEVARWFQVSGGHVMKARQQRADGYPPLIVPAKWENGHALYDAGTLTYRKDMLVGPVRKGHPLAAELTKLINDRRSRNDRSQDVPLRRPRGRPGPHVQAHRRPGCRCRHRGLRSRGVLGRARRG
jgi:hypothetical protein